MVPTLSYAHKEIVDKLRANRLDRFIQLPAIVVGGDTSSGKSSLLTAISGLQFPASSGLTTRCPTQVILSCSSVRRATVTLQHFDDMTSEQQSFRRELDRDRTDFENAITEATELLTQGKDKSYITPNAIVIEASGPDLCDLTLIDLPGLVSACGKDENDSIMAQVNSMIDSQMRSSRAVILCVLPANNDFHNSGILTMAKAQHCDPSGVRTLGIITKPDLVDKGAEEDVINLASNESAHLQLGWHTVKLRSQEDLRKKSCRAAEGDEADFFSADPWTSLAASDVGIPKLRERLQALLLQRVQAELPQVFEEVQGKIKSVEAELGKLGAPCDDLAAKRRVLTTSVEAIAAVLEASSDGRYYGSFFNDAKPMYANNLRAHVCKVEASFREAVLQTRHMCVDNYEVGDSVIWDGGTSAVVEGKAPDGTFTIRYCDAGGSETKKKDGVKEDKLKPFREPLIDKLNNMRGDHLPGFESHVVFRAIVSEKLAAWVEPAKSLRMGVVKLLQDMMSRTVDYATSPSLPLLRAHLKKCLRQQVDQCAERLEASMGSFVRAERERPYTQNHYYSDLLTKMRNDGLKHRLAALKDSSDRVSCAAMLAVLESYGVGTSSIEESAAADLEIRLAAYLKVASKRVVDEMPRIVNDVLIRPFLESVRGQVQISDPQLQDILEEDATIVEKRAKLGKNLAALQEGLVVLREHFRNS